MMPVTLGNDAERHDDDGMVRKIMLAMTHGNGTFGKWGAVIVATLGMVLLVIGANMPNFALCVIGLALLASVGTVRFIMFRNGRGLGDAVSDADYRRDLVATLNGYGLDGKYDDDDIDRATSDFMSRQEGGVSRSDGEAWHA